MRTPLLALALLVPHWALAAKYPEFEGEPLARGRAVWLGTCEACHGNPDSDAPQALDKAAGKPRLAKGRAALYASALAGRKGDGGAEMPARGGNSRLTDDEVRAAVDYMARLATR
jgi:cytochrome c5